MSLRSTLALHLGDLRENPREREARVNGELGDPSAVDPGTMKVAEDGQLWRVEKLPLGRFRWSRLLTLTPEKRDLMYRLIGYGRWFTLAYLLVWAAFYALRLDALSVGGMVPTTVLFDGMNSIAPAFLLIFFLRFLPKTAGVIEEDGSTSPA